MTHDAMGSPTSAEPTPEVQTRVEQLTRNADLHWAADTLVVARDEILQRWLSVTSKQPFHAGRHGDAVSDHVPHLFDAVVAVLRRSAAPRDDPAAPLDDPQVREYAGEHARVRFHQGLRATDIVTEFRLLRHEIGWVLRTHANDATPTGDVVAAELLINDALDGAISVALTELTDHVETLREEALAMIVHDVRQPITSIRGSIQLAIRGLERQTPDTQRILDSLHRALDATDAVNERLILLSEASRTALGAVELHLERTNFVDVVRESIGRLDTDSANRMRLHVNDEQNVSGRWDTIALTRLVDNLVTNAIKYSEPSTPIDILIGGHAQRLRFSVRDHGIGLTREDLKRIFGRYERAEHTITDGIDGQGLGLYLARGIVAAHGGRIWAESDGQGKGATFIVELPRAPNDV